MTYTEWKTSNKEKKVKILLKLHNKTNVEIAEYFSYKNMVKNEKDFCSLYKENLKCHDMDNLNCFHCGCPHFQYTEDKTGLFTQDGLPVLSKCNVNAIQSKQFTATRAIHQDCSDCLIPHTFLYTTKTIKDNNVN